MKEYYILYIESYVLIRTNGKDVFIFNVLNNEKFIISKYNLHPKLKEFLFNISLNPHAIYLEINKYIHFELMNDQTFINLRESFIIDSIIICSNSIPVFLSCKPRIHSGARQKSIGNMFNPFDEIFLHVNGGHIEYKDTLVSNYYKQFNFPIAKTDSISKLENLLRFIDVFIKYKVRSINLNVHQWNSIKAIDMFIKKCIDLKNLNLMIHVTFLEFKILVDSFSRLGFEPERYYVYFFELLPNVDKIDAIIDYCSIYLVNRQIVFCVIIKNSNEYGYAEKLSKNNPHCNFQYLPYLDGSNDDFMKSNIAFTLDELTSANHSLRDISVNEKLNSCFYGKIIIDANGDLYTSFNLNKIGNIFEKNSQIREKLHNQESLWFLTRNKVKPCMDCLFNCFCPPINDYNLNLGSFDLCKIDKVHI